MLDKLLRVGIWKEVLINLKNFYKKLPKAKWEKRVFILKLPRNASLLDIGCGNGAAKTTKFLRPDLYFAGIDVENYNNSKEEISYADEYNLVDPMQFPEGILEMGGRQRRFDSISSSHNIEHCNRPEETLDAMCEKLKSGGVMFLSFPSEESVNFPHRKGTLNYYDDPTHRKPIIYKEVIQRLEKNGMEISYAKKRYRPVLWSIVGMILEPVSRQQKRIMRGTWAYWGFETVIWAVKI